MLILKKTYESDIDKLAQESEQRQSLVDAIKKHNAYVCFTPDGTVTEANEKFANMFGYSATELAGKHHRSLCFDDFSHSPDYTTMWKNLRAGIASTGQFRRRHRNDKILWLEASYNPVLDGSGNVVSVLKICTDVTEKVNIAEANRAVSDTLNRTMLVIEFTTEGKVITANSNFLKAVGYSLEEVRGQPHRIFCFDDFYSETPDFWEKLRSGIHNAGQFKRKDAAGNTVWLEATYSPIYSPDGKVDRIIKFAADITELVTTQTKIASASEHAVSISEETSQIALRGKESLSSSVQFFNTTLQEVVETNDLISQLTAQSANIEQIVSTIRGIADQTNLLALNAAIEAARAGDQGRGFAVVADEVRQLAKRTSDSTIEIESVVGENKGLAQKAHDKMSGVRRDVDANAEQIQSVQTIMEEIYQGAVSVSENVARIMNK